jgi:hypothetical protein
MPVGRPGSPLCTCLRASGTGPSAHVRLGRTASAEKLIGSIRRECSYYVVALGEGHLPRTLQSHARYYNESRTRRSLKKDAPFHRPIEGHGAIISRPVLGGLHTNARRGLLGGLGKKPVICTTPQWASFRASSGRKLARSCASLTGFSRMTAAFTGSS